MIHVINWFVNILTLGLVSIATITTTTYHVDEPIVELNNQTLNDVFNTGNLVTNGDFDNDATNWDTFLITTPIITNGIETHTVTSRFGRLSQAVAQTLGNTYYALTRLKVPYTDFRFELWESAGVDTQLQITTINEFTTISSIRTTTTSNDLRIGVVDWKTSTWSPIHIDYIYVYDLTDLGIDHLTQNELDDWYDIYLQATANNGVYIESSSHLNNNIHLVDVSVMVISFGFWTWLYKFLKGVVL
jgi:hypothetical protein